MKVYIHKKTCTVVFLTDLLMIAKPGNSHMSINGRTGKQPLLCSFTEIPLVEKQTTTETTNTHINMDKFQKHVEWETPDTK